jgi:hypothetical protein
MPASRAFIAATVDEHLGSAGATDSAWRTGF